MSAARINIRNIDYFKYKKLVIDGNRDDYNASSKEVKSLCDSVQLLNFRDEEFDDESDRSRFGEIIALYRQILASKRIEALDMRIKSGWWGDHKNAYSAGKIKPQALKDVLLHKAKEWKHRHGESPENIKEFSSKIDGPGLFVFKHKDHQCFQFIGRADKIFSKCGEKLKAAFEGSLHEPLAALLIISMASDWDFYFMPVGPQDDEKILRIMENDLILKHDCIWPHGLNFSLHVDSLLEVSEFRKSCIRHNWPPDGDALDSLEINVEKLRSQIQNVPTIEVPVAQVAPMRKKKPKEEKDEERPQWSDDFRIDRKAKDDRPASPASVTSENAEMTSSTTSSSSDTQKQQAAAAASASTPASGRKQPQNKPLSGVKKTSARKPPGSPAKEPAKSKPVQKSGSTHSLGSDKSADEQAESATRTVTPVLSQDNKPHISKGKGKQTASQKKSPQPVRKEATRIIKTEEPEVAEEEPATDAAAPGEDGEAEEKIDSSTRPVTPTLAQEQVVDTVSLVSQVSVALQESAQLQEDEQKENEPEPGEEDGDAKTMKLASVPKTKLPSPRHTPKTAAKTKKVKK